MMKTSRAGGYSVFSPDGSGDCDACFSTSCSEGVVEPSNDSVAPFSRSLGIEASGGITVDSLVTGTEAMALNRVVEMAARAVQQLGWQNREGVR